MDGDNTFYLAVAAMAVASFATRAAGFVLMGYIPITPRVEAALRAMPLGVMIGIVTPAVAAGKLPELIALAAVGVSMKLFRHDLVAAMAGAATVAICRWILA
ncbi:MAG: AzlD domain-containing protein [Pseudomonadota bacterium]